MALKGEFSSKVNTPLNKEGFYKSISASGYEVVVDTKGRLLWEDQKDEKRPLLIITSENVNQEYLKYLNDKHISWIACGKKHIDLKRACEILIDEFEVKRMVVVGGGHINGGFLEAGLLDEVSILIGAGIDGRNNMGAVFDGLKIDRPVTLLKLEHVESFDSGAIWIKYKVR